MHGLEQFWASLSEFLAVMLAYGIDVDPNPETIFLNTLMGGESARIAYPSGYAGIVDVAMRGVDPRGLPDHQAILFDCARRHFYDLLERHGYFDGEVERPTNLDDPSYIALRNLVTLRIPATPVGHSIDPSHDRRMDDGGNGRDEPMAWLAGNGHNFPVLDKSEPIPPEAPPPIDASKAPVVSIQLGEPDDDPVVWGITKTRLTLTQYRVVKALVDAHPDRLSLDMLRIKSKTDHPVGIIDRIRKKDQDWADVLDKPGQAHGGYGIRLKRPRSATPRKR